MKNDQKLSKSAILAQLIYKAIVRYVKAKKSPVTAKNQKFSLDFKRVWRGNIKKTIDKLENSNEYNQR